MKQRKNKRTLKKRISRVIFFCILFTILLYSAGITFLAANISREQAFLITDYFAAYTAQSINSEYFLKQMGIDSLEKLYPESPKFKDWVEDYKKNKSFSLSKNFPAAEQIKHQVEYEQSLKEISVEIHSDNIFDFRNLVYTKISLNGMIIYNDEIPGELKPKPSSQITDSTEANGNKGWIVQNLLNYYSKAKATYPLTDSKGNTIGEVSSVFNTDLILLIYSVFCVLIISLALVALIISNIISKFLSIPVINPLKQLDEKIKAIAGENAAEKQILLKKPLREIESLAASTNLVFNKMQEYNNQLTNQKLELANQNEELEAQNEELLESRKQIDEQKRLLENQNEELEAQNEELIESQKKLEEAQTLLAQNESMASIGQLTAAITHEINTPLGAINSNVQIYDMFIGMLLQNPAVDANEDLKGIISQMKETNNISIMACQRVSDIIKSLKNFSKLDQAEFQEADINEGIRSVLVLTSNLWKKKIKIHEDYKLQFKVKCFSGLLNQVFMNIIVNAIHAIEEKGDIFIGTFSDDNNIYISIKDTGTGISEDNLQKIFHPGFTTKGAGIGMGLGLSICENIVRKHDGEIRVSSELGKGTEFLVCMPIKK